MKQLFAVLIALVLVGCSAVSKPPTVTHVVVFWLKQPGDEAGRQKLIDASHELRAIPTVGRLTVGRAIPSTRPVVDSTYDVALVIEFADEEAMHAYEVHPLHKKAVSEVLRPLTAKVLVYDIKHAQAAPPSTKR